jgi:hypothetical protein
LLDPDRLRAHPPPQSLSERDIASLDEAWSAVTAHDPGPLLTLLAAQPGPLPYLQNESSKLLASLSRPDYRLNAWETELLRLVDEKRPEAKRVIGFTIGRNLDTLELVGDGYLFDRDYH